MKSMTPSSYDFAHFCEDLCLSHSIVFGEMERRVKTVACNASLSMYLSLFLSLYGWWGVPLFLLLSVICSLHVCWRVLSFFSFSVCIKFVNTLVKYKKVGIVN